MTIRSTNISPYEGNDDILEKKLNVETTILEIESTQQPIINARRTNCKGNRQTIVFSTTKGDLGEAKKP